MTEFRKQTLNYTCHQSFIYHKKKLSCVNRKGIARENRFIRALFPSYHCAGPIGYISDVVMYVMMKCKLIQKFKNIKSSTPCEVTQKQKLRSPLKFIHLCVQRPKNYHIQIKSSNIQKKKKILNTTTATLSLEKKNKTTTNGTTKIKTGAIQVNKCVKI